MSGQHRAEDGGDVARERGTVGSGTTSERAARTYTRASMESGASGTGDRVQRRSSSEDEHGAELDPRLAIAVVGAHEQERSRLAEELHDGPAQALANAIFQTEIVDRLIGDDPSAARAEIAGLRQMLTRELDTLRAYINQLRPSLDEAEGLDEALRDSAAAASERSGLPIDVRLGVSGASLHPAARTVVLRVAQEALRNIAKHAAASRAWVTTSSSPAGDGRLWTLEVGDDGQGFDLSTVSANPNRRHFGLRFMRERSELLGSELTITTRPAGGTVVRLTIEQEGERS